MGYLSCSTNPDRRHHPHTWDPEMAGLIDWFEGTRLPDQPYDLYPGLRVIDPGKFYGNIHLQIADGSAHSQGKLGFLRATLRCLYAKFG